jgi:hypothetical protein
MRKSCLVLAGIIVVLAPLCNSIAESDTPEIILENGFYYVIQPNGEKVAIVSEEEPNALNKAKLSPDRQYVVYTTANGLGFESEGRDLFYCKTDGTQRTFLHKFPAHVNDWIWVTKDKNNFLIVILDGMGGPGIWVLDFNKKKLLLSFSGDSVERVEGTDCYKIVGIRKETKICPDELVRIRQKGTIKPKILINWMGDQVYLSTEKGPIFGSDDVLKCFEPVYDLLSMQERSSYREIHHRLSDHIASFAEEPISLARNKIVFSIGGMHGQFDLRRRKIEVLDIGGDLSLKVFCSLTGKYVAILKTEPTGIKKLIILNKAKGTSWENVLTKEFSSDATISNLEWSKQDETKIYYSLKEGAVTKDSCEIDLTKAGKK